MIGFKIFRDATIIRGISSSTITFCNLTVDGAFYEKNRFIISHTNMKKDIREISVIQLKSVLRII